MILQRRRGSGHSACVPGRAAGIGNAATDASRSKQERRKEDMMRSMRLVCLTALVVFASGLARAQVSDDVVKIGVLTDLSGPSATADGPGSVTAAQMAVDDFGGKVLDKPIALISADHQIKPTSPPALPGSGTTATRST